MSALKSRRIIFSALATLSILVGRAVAEDGPSIAWPEPDGRATISRPFAGSTIAVSVSSRTAGAIDSLTWAGTQFINDHDHGRELQSASSYDGYGECLNPTEAGSDGDANGPSSSSLLTALEIGPAMLLTRTQMAYFMSPGRPVGSCPKGPGPYNSPRSDDVLTKRVTLGSAGVANAIEYRATFTTAQAHDSATFEVATAYMPPDFAHFWSFDPATAQAAVLSPEAGEQGLPVILSTADGSRAMGVYSPSLPQPALPNAGYGRFDFSTLPGAGNATVKWNCVFRANAIPAGDHTYTCYVVVGTLQDVKDGMRVLRTALGGVPAPFVQSNAAPVPHAEVATGVALFVGVEAGCNAGVVTVDPGYRGCATAPVGSTRSLPTSSGDVAVFVGTAVGLDAGLVTSNPNHLNAGTRPIGFLTNVGSDGTPLYVGTQGGCNAGVVSTNPAHLNCRSAPLGFAAR
ncbi:hypothetical protein MKK55_10015 [Methylobacterium sp. J-059]|uniref:hypothetical protein n=1 Tax=Methylobacterium sp. J-059 TaxID=2836643 RepID=UPI001FB9A7C8|nr:hypothetical protein [Methylobacterium sp. J-059]MCJ2039273.1 hypothetical protein [Methylobacterium sp. J-059]